MIYSPIKIYKTHAKTGPIFFQHPDKIKLLIVMSEEELGNDIFKNNIQKSVEALGLHFETEALITGLGKDEKLNWAGLNEFPDLKIAYFGEKINPFPALKPNQVARLDNLSVLLTYSMSEIVKEPTKKGQFWNHFRTFVQA